MEHVREGIWRLEVPLPGSPLKNVNSYVIPGRPRHLVIDTGMNRPECKVAFDEAAAQLGIRLEDADFFATHYHTDHLGLVPVLASPQAALYMGATEAAAVDRMRGHPAFWAEVARRAAPAGIPDDVLDQVLRDHPGVKYRPPVYPEFRRLADGAALEAAGMEFVCIETPGHTVGHMCLYEPRLRLLFSGDHVLGDLSPNISALYGEEDPLAEFLASLDKVKTLDVDLVLPGHRRPFGNLSARVEELKAHHETRACETIEALGEQPATAYEIASRLTWDISVKEWEQFPVLQKWFATGEADAHLRYLVRRGRAHRQHRAGLDWYSRAL